MILDDGLKEGEVEGEKGIDIERTKEPKLVEPEVHLNSSSKNGWGW